MATSNSYMYYMFSNTHLKKLQSIYDKIDKDYTPNKVLVGGKWKQYTDVISSPNDCIYSDAILITSGYIKDMKISKE